MIRRLEANGVLDNTTDPMQIDYYNLIVGGVGQYGFAFTYPAGASTCFCLSAPGILVIFGANRTLVTSSFDLSTLGACGLF